jgi:hypothetical protein
MAFSRYRWPEVSPGNIRPVNQACDCAVQLGMSLWANSGIKPLMPRAFHLLRESPMSLHNNVG